MFRQSLCFAVTISGAKKTLSYWQLASVVLDEGDEACTANLCQKCFNKHLQAKGEVADKRAVETGGGAKMRIMEGFGA